ncbi:MULTISPECIES: hypothetical protein [Delftia]|uniref:hypothetical protein n=1 Tax=Delftia TaxID=80865 RepID=UPI000B32FE43|nr:hypothetical protein [Delftia lacustris]
MKRLLVMAFLATVLISSEADAATVFGFVKESSKSGTPKAYLANSPVDMGYVTIKATVEGGSDAGCISPGLSNLWRKVFSQETEVFLAAQVWGFKGVESGKWIPIASYKWDNKGQFCNSVFQPAVVLVPLTPISPSTDIAGPGKSGQPYLRIALRFQSKRNEKISSAFNTVLQVASTYATGGTAGTLTQLLGFAGDPAIKIISNQFQEIYSASSDQDHLLQLSWDDLRSGSLEYPLQLLSIDKGANETVQNALERMARNPSAATSLARLRILLNTRRSIFFADDLIASAAPGYSVSHDDAAVSRYAVLNFPEGISAGVSGAVSSVQQLLSSEAPELTKELATERYPAACQKLMRKLNSAGFNRHDSALIVSAVLDEARTDWRTDAGFIGTCIPDNQLFSTIEVLRPPVVPPLRAPVDAEVPTNLDSFVTVRHQNFLVGLRDALVSFGVSKKQGLGEAFKGLPTDATWTADTAQLPVDMKVSEAAVSGDLPSQLQQLTVVKAGCFVSYMTPNGDPHLGMAVVVNDPQGAARPYLLTMKMDPAKMMGPLPASGIKSVWLLDLQQAPPQANAFAKSVYAQSGICYIPEPRNGAAIIKKLAGV